MLPPPPESGSPRSGVTRRGGSAQRATPTDPSPARPSATRTIPEYRLLGTRVHALTVQDWLDVVDEAASTGIRRIMVGQNLHSVYLCEREPDLAEVQEMVDYVRIDGLPLVAFCRLLGMPVTIRHRSGFMDLLDPLMRRATDRGWRVFYLGSKPGVAARGADLLRERFPGLRIDTAHGYFDPTDAAANEAVVETINHFRPHVLVVGMGMPRQERWIRTNHERLDAPAIVASGAAMDYVAGEVATAPRWLSALGLEWLFRLAAEPGRLWRRYLVEPWTILGLFARDLRTRYGSGRVRRE